MPDPHNLAAIPQQPQKPLDTAKGVAGPHVVPRNCVGLECRGRERNGHLQLCELPPCCCRLSRPALQQGLGDGGVGFGVRGEGRADLSRIRPPATIDRQPMRSPTAMNGAFTPVTLWNGQFGANRTQRRAPRHNWAEGTPHGGQLLGVPRPRDPGHRRPDGASGWRRTRSSLSACPDTLRLFDAAFPETLQEGPAGTAWKRRAWPSPPTSGPSWPPKHPSQRWLRGEQTAMTPEQQKGRGDGVLRGGSTAAPATMVPD